MHSFCCSLHVVILVLFFVFTAFSTNANGTVTESTLTTGCKDYAISSANAEARAYGSTISEWFDSAFEYYKNCMEAGGNIAPPVFL